MNKNFLALILLLPSLKIIAQNEYSIDKIPEDLKKNTNAIIRDYTFEGEISSQDKMTYRISKAVTVLAKNCEEYNTLSVTFDKYQDIKQLEILIHDASGKQIKKIKRNDFTESSAFDGFSLYSDDKILRYTYTPSQIPFTIAYTYEISTSNTAFIPSYFPLDDYGVSIEKSSFQLTYPEDIELKIKEKNIDQFNIENSSKPGLISYSLALVRALESEPYSPDYLHIFPSIRLAPSKFSLSGVRGSAVNWEDFGRWYYQNLLDETGDLNNSTRSKVMALTQNQPDELERAKIIYQFMQDKTRYISVQIGIGGWKPMPADDVDRLGYGDCKALTNYTASLLKAANVNAFYSIIYGGRKRNIESDIPAIQGNHVILMVPTAKDTVWLECTNQKVPFGHLGDFTDDRDALVITPEGGKIIHTKTYEASENFQKITGILKIDENGDVDCELSIESEGVQLDSHYPLADLSTKDKNDYYKSYFGHINNLDLQKISNEMLRSEGKFREELQFSAKNYGVKAGDRMLIKLNAFNVQKGIPPVSRDRKFPLVINYGYEDVDEITICIPEGYELEANPKNTKLTNNFGSYEIFLEKLENNRIKYSRKVRMNAGEFPAASYNEFREFKKQINQLDNSKIVIIKSKNS